MNPPTPSPRHSPSPSNARKPISANPIQSIRRDADKLEGNRVGARATGLYPEVSRAKLAALTKLHISTITGIFKGRTKPKLELAIYLAKSLRIPLEQLNRDLKKAQAENQAERERRKVEAERRRRIEGRGEGRMA